MDPDQQNLGWSGTLSFFIIYKFWQNCASIRQVSDLILKTVWHKNPIVKNKIKKLISIMVIQHFYSEIYPHPYQSYNHSPKLMPISWQIFWSTSLTHWGLGVPCGVIYLGKLWDSADGQTQSVGNKPLPQLMLTHHWRCLLAFAL